VPLGLADALADGEADFEALALALAEAEADGLALLLALALALALGEDEVVVPPLQATPLIAKAVGIASLLVQVPWKPNVVLAPEAMEPL
jgi:hypothetical protein